MAVLLLIVKTCQTPLEPGEVIGNTAAYSKADDLLIVGSAICPHMVLLPLSDVGTICGLHPTCAGRQLTRPETCRLKGHGMQCVTSFLDLTSFSSQLFVHR